MYIHNYNVAYASLFSYVRVNKVSTKLISVYKIRSYVDI